MQVKKVVISVHGEVVSR